MNQIVIKLPNIVAIDIDNSDMHDPAHGSPIIFLIKAM
jgi:hypothetical protein